MKDIEFNEEIIQENKFKLILSPRTKKLDIINYFNKIDSIIILDPEIKKYFDKNITIYNYSVFMYFIYNKFGNESLIEFLREILIKKLKIESLNSIVNQEESSLSNDLYTSICDNALNQSIDINYPEFVMYILNKEKNISCENLSKLIVKHNIDVLKYILENKITLSDFSKSEYSKYFISKNSDKIFNPVGIIKEKSVIKNNFQVTQRHLLYFLYKNKEISKEEKAKILKELMRIVKVNIGDTLSNLIKIRDQDLVEEILFNEQLNLSKINMINSFLFSLKFNCPRISFLLFKSLDDDISFLKNESIHRGLIRSIIEFPENIDIQIYLMKKFVCFLSIPNSSYLISILEQIIIFKNQNDCSMLKMVNPLKICILISELLDIICENLTQLQTICGDLKNKYLKIACCLIDEPKEKVAIENALKDKDIEGREVLDIICALNYYEVLNNKVVEQMSLKIWNGPHSTQGRFYDTSTIFNVIWNCESVFEIRNSINEIFIRAPNKIKTLPENYVNWKDCAKLKFYNYIAIFFIFNLFFQSMNNIFSFSLSDKLNTMHDLLVFVRIFVTRFNFHYNSTFSLSDILGNATDNKTFQYLYILPLNQSDMNDLKSIGTSVKTIADELPLTKEILIILLRSSYIYLLSITQIYFRYYYSKMTGKKLKLLDNHLILDIIIFALVLARIYSVDSLFPPLLDMNNIDKYDNTVRIKYAYLMGFFLTLLWIKLIIYLKFSVTLGPLIRILELIFIRLFWFLFLFFGEIIIFTLIGNLLFIHDKNSSDFLTVFSSFVKVFGQTIQNFNFKTFDKNHIFVATIFLVVHLSVSSIILVNTLTSIISATHDEFSKSSILLLHQDMILRKNEFISDEYYGGIILLPFPLSIFNIIFVPFYFIIADKNKLKFLNKILLYIGYSPLFLFSTTFYIFFELFIYPLAFIKIIFIVLYEVILGNNHYQTKSNSRLSNSFLGLLILILYPFWALIAMVLDLILYVKCLFFDVVFDTYYHLENNEVTPFILDKIGAIFDDKNKRLEIPLDKVIREYVDRLGEFNINYDFKNLLLLGQYPEDNINLLKDYSVFVKFIHQLKLLNEYNESVLYKKFLIKLCESNANYVQIMKHLQKIEKTDLISKEINNSEQEKLKVQNIYIKNSKKLDIIKTPSITEQELVKKLNQNKILGNFEKLPKLFYKRLSIINLKSCYNALNQVKNFENIGQTQNKIKNDSRNIRKNISDILNVINAKKITEDKKRIKISDVKEKRFMRQNSINVSTNTHPTTKIQANKDKFVPTDDIFKRSLSITSESIEKRFNKSNLFLDKNENNDLIEYKNNANLNIIDEVDEEGGLKSNFFLKLKSPVKSNKNEDNFVESFNKNTGKIKNSFDESLPNEKSNLLLEKSNGVPDNLFFE